MIVVLAGGTGGAKLARGMLDVVGGAELVVVANTADDVEVHAVHVSPDPDLVTLWLADLIDPRGYGLRGDTWGVMDGLEALGRPAWFRLGDRDLALCLVRTELLRSGERPTAAQAAVARGLGVEARVLPMADEPVRTHVLSAGRRLPFQEFMIVEGGAATEGAGAQVEGVELVGLEAARPTPEVLAALIDAEAIVIGPSNPVISIGPILGIPGMREALASASAPVVAVSPFVGGRAVKGPTDAFVAHAGLEPGAAAIVEAYGDVLDGVVADEPAPGLPGLVTDTLMDTREARRRVAAETLDFARGLTASRGSAPAADR